MNKFLPNKNKLINWPNSPDLVKKPNRLIPKFEKYYPSISDMNFMQKVSTSIGKNNGKKGIL
jgi:hypothetical protein